MGISANQRLYWRLHPGENALHRSAQAVGPLKVNTLASGNTVAPRTQSVVQSNPSFNSRAVAMTGQGGIDRQGRSVRASYRHFSSASVMDGDSSSRSGSSHLTDACFSGRNESDQSETTPESTIWRAMRRNPALNSGADSKTSSSMVASKLL